MVTSFEFLFISVNLLFNCKHCVLVNFNNTVHFGGWGEWVLSKTGRFGLRNRLMKWCILSSLVTSSIWAVISLVSHQSGKGGSYEIWNQFSHSLFLISLVLSSLFFLLLSGYFLSSNSSHIINIHQCVKGSKHPHRCQALPEHYNSIKHGAS